MYCFPLKWLKRQSRRSRTSQQEEEKEGREVETERIQSTSSVAAEPVQIPEIKFTPCSENMEERKDDSSDVGVGERRVMRPRKQNISTASDSGYVSLPSTTTLDVFRPRTLTESSNDSSSTTYHTPQGSVRSEHSPTSNTSIEPQFPTGSQESADLKHLIDAMDELKRMVERLTEIVERREKENNPCLEPVESIPDLTELPSSQCERAVILWLVTKVTDWKFLARWLRLEENVISRIELDYPKSDREQCYQMFLKWKSVDPENYTYFVLGEALRQESKELFNEFVREVRRV